MKMTGRKGHSKSYRNDILKFTMEQYGTEPDYPWISLPNYAVLRHCYKCSEGRYGHSGVDTGNCVGVH